ncbi:ABC transporter substrate-binding protein [Microbacterium sp. T32]|uniref:ABC transporter substrate-binding protein n=1 Tax=Microbacterium sp. T32 TaxID=1776083 RepID=UPI0007AB976E|nr:extracellular solute-binding protein [Microbacterium sp. T32]KZE42416.1 ABC transporter substrate-binding protein [Microbacterium sp. T32]
MNTSTSATLTRRGFLGLAGVAAAVPILAACAPGAAGGGGAAGGALKFWDMQWGPAAYGDAAKKLTESYAAKNGLPAATYQSLPWNNFYQTFSSAIASKTGPAVSSGSGFQAFQFADQGAIAYADNLIDKLRSSGKLDDFLPGTVESMKTAKGYAAVPWQSDIRVLWYRKSLLDQAGVDVPTDWKSYLEAAKALAKIGVVGLGTGAGAGNNLGNHLMASLMINNGGGIFNAEGKPDLVTDANIEAMEFVLELSAAGAIDPAALTYTSDNLQSQWADKRIGLGWNSAGLQNTLNGDEDLFVASPVSSYSGNKGTLAFVNNLMMYTNTPSQEGSEAFLEAYLDGIHVFWDQGLINALPVLKSIVASEAFQANTQWVKIIDEWQPVSKPYATLSDTLFAGLAVVDGGQSITQFTQTMLAGKTDAKSALQTFQSALEKELA